LIGLAGCAPEPGEPRVTLAEWSVTVPKAAPRPVTLPAQIDLPREPVDYVLSADVEAPPGSGPLALTFADLPGLATLRANGTLATPCSDAPFDRYRSEGPQCWHVARPRPDEALHLELTVHHRYEMSDYVRSPAVLSATASGDRAFRAVRNFDALVPLAAALLAASTGLLYAMVFFVDRSRRASGWMGLQANSIVPLCLYWFGITQPLFGVWDTLVAGVLGIVAALAAVHFSHAQLGLRPPPRWVGYAFGAALAVSVALYSPFRILPAARVVLFVCTATILYITGRSTLAIRDPEKRVAGIVMAVTWFLNAATGWTDEEYFLGLAPHCGGFHALSIGVGAVALGQSGLLAYEHARSLRRADDLNVELAARVETLELRDRENRTLTDELRRQIARRSDELTEALVREVAGGETRAARPGDGEILNDRYRVLRTLGTGGMGTVFQVERLADGARLALKAHHGGGTEDSLARLAREARIAAEVQHPNLVSIVDIDVARAGWLFLVMELVEGATLAEAIARHGDVGWSLPVLAQIAEGMSALHEVGIVHRDLKPANILLAGGVEHAAPRVKITDFGVSSMRDASAFAATLVSMTRKSPRPASDSALTHTGVWLGTPMYMAPETLARGSHSVGPEVDVFSFGVLAHELLSKEYPFEGPPILDAAMGRAPRPARSLRGVEGVVESVVDLLDACLALRIEDRPRAVDVAAILRCAVAHGPVREAKVV
jgi:serine/threonine-protein kinase